MNPIVRNVLAVIAGWLAGSIINMGLVTVGHSVMPIEGVNPNDYEALAAVMAEGLESKYFIFPFIAHALGTLAGALVAGMIAANHKMTFAIAIGGLFLVGGIMVSFVIPAPTWFVATDLIIAYIPMAFIGGKIAMKVTKSQPSSEI